MTIPLQNTTGQKEVTDSDNIVEENTADSEQKKEDEVKTDFKYKIMTENFPPFNYEENGKVTGIATENCSGNVL